MSNNLINNDEENDIKIQNQIDKFDSDLDKINNNSEKLQRKRKNLLDKLTINIKKKAKMDDISYRQNTLLDEISSLRQKQHQMDLQISQIEDQIRDIEREKCIVIGHVWIPDLSYNSKEGERICERCGIFD